MAERVGIRQLDVAAIERGRQRPARRYLAGYERAAGLTLEGVRNAVAAIEAERAERKRAKAERKVAAAARAAGEPVQMVAPKPPTPAPGAEFPPMRCVPTDRAAAASARAKLVSRVRKLGVDDPHAALRALPADAFYALEDAQRAGTLDDRTLAKALGVKPQAESVRERWQAEIRAKHDALERAYGPEVKSLLPFELQARWGIAFDQWCDAREGCAAATIEAAGREMLAMLDEAEKVLASERGQFELIVAPWRREVRTIDNRLSTAHGIEYEADPRVSVELNAVLMRAYDRWHESLCGDDAAAAVECAKAYLRALEAVERALAGDGALAHPADATELSKARGRPAKAKVEKVDPRMAGMREAILQGRARRDAFAAVADPIKARVDARGRALVAEYGEDALERVDPELRGRFLRQLSKWCSALNHLDADAAKLHGEAMLRAYDALERALSGAVSAPSTPVIELPRPSPPASKTNGPRPGTGAWLRERRLTLEVPTCEVAKALAWDESTLHNFEVRNNITLSGTQRKKLDPLFAAYAARADLVNGHPSPEHSR